MERKKIRFFIVLSLGQNEDCSFRYGVRRGIFGFFMGAVRDDVRRGIIGFYMGALRWDWGDARAFSRRMGRFPRALTDSDMTSRNMETPSHGLRSCSRNMRRQVCGLRQRFRRALEEGQSAGGRDDVSRETIVISFCFS